MCTCIRNNLYLCTHNNIDMMKKHYFKPTMQMAQIETFGVIQDGTVNRTAGGTLNYGGGSSGSARSKENGFDSDWDDEKDEWEE